MIWKPLVALALVLLTAWAYTQWRDVQRDVGAAAERADWVVKINDQKAEAKKLLDAANERVRMAEAAASAARSSQDLKDNQNAKLTSENSRLLLAAGRLRDPNATPARCGGSGADAASAPVAGTGNRDSDGAETSGLLSMQLSNLLRARLREADEINDAYASCRADLRSRIANY